MEASKVHNPIDIETLAILRGLQFCIHHGMLNLIIESDCLLVVEAHTFPGAPNFILGSHFLDIRDLMSHFVCCKIQYGNRLGNTTAYRLKKHARNVSDVALWYGDVSLFLEHNVWFDKLNL